ncbi:MAG TPA: DUF2911 domain-containing protein [Thermoanaerobaculia bacterium]
MRKLTTLAFCTLFLATAALAQHGGEAKKPLSPATKAEATVKGKKITVDYSAPSKRGRAIMGELVPYGKVWRTGANAATTLTTEADLMIGSLHVPAGKYTLFTIPGEKEWTLIVNKQTGQWGTNYDEKQDLGRVKLTVVPVQKPVETFNIAVGDTLAFSWDNTKAWVPVVVH